MNPYQYQPALDAYEREAAQRERSLLDGIRRAWREWLLGAGAACLGVATVFASRAVGLAL